MAYFVRVGRSAFAPTEHVSGAWRPDEQHVAPALGLLLHVLEADRDARRGDGLVVGRLSYDILGTMPLDEVDTAVRVVRAGRTIELVEGTLACRGRTAVVLRAWLLQPGDTGAVAGTALPRIAPPQDMPAWDAATVWSGGFVASVEIRRVQAEPGRAAFWVRPRVPLLRDEEVGPWARAAAVFDLANGVTVRVDPRRHAFPNIDLTAHLFAPPRGDWIGFDTTVSLGPGGVGLTSSVLHDAAGPVGAVAQCLTVRPVPDR